MSTPKKLMTVTTLNDQQAHLESRVVAVEANLDAMSRNLADLTGDVRDLARGIKEQGTQFEAQMRELLVAVTNASGPRKTDWHLLLGAVTLILALGAAAFSPVVFRINDTQAQVQKLEYDLKARLHESDAESHRKTEQLFAETVQTRERLVVLEYIAKQQEKPAGAASRGPLYFFTPDDGPTISQ